MNRALMGDNDIVFNNYIDIAIARIKGDNRYE